MKIRTNHHRREILDGWQLTASERKQFDYLDWPAIDEGTDSASFIRYHGVVYDLGEMDGRAGESMPGWDAYQADSYSTGTVFKYVEDNYDTLVIVGRYSA
jgi:hypothetical protein